MVVHVKVPTKRKPYRPKGAHKPESEATEAPFGRTAMALWVRAVFLYLANTPVKF